jgi:hypothetical protein
MKPLGPLTLAGVLGLLLIFASLAPAQLPWRWFGQKNPDKNPPDKNTPAKSPLPDPRRVLEINVEIAWLADPATFPYYLEAHINNGQQLEVRGYVPNKAVRDQALRTAQVYSSLPVVDSLKEHSSLLVRPSQITTQQLHSSAISSLKVALPKQFQQLKVDCSNDGKVYVFGPVISYEERVIVSHSLRRLHGCTSVQNMTSVPADLAINPGNTIFAMGQPANPEGKSKPWLPWSVANAGSKQEPPLADPQRIEGPVLIQPTVGVKEKGPDLDMRGVEVVKVALPASNGNKNLTVEELQSRIQKECPQATAIAIAFPSPAEVRITINARSAEDISPIAERIFAMPELQNYRSDLQFKIGK